MALVELGFSCFSSICTKGDLELFSPACVFKSGFFLLFLSFFLTFFYFLVE